METRISGDNARNAIRNLGFNHFIIEEAQGFAGGIWIRWNNDNLKITKLESHSQYIHTKIEAPYKEECYLTAVYASLQAQNCRSLWPLLQNIANRLDKAWLLTGDFNEIKDPIEKKGGGDTNNRACRKFKEWINHCGLIDLGFVGTRFTWRGPKREGQDKVLKRVDRALANSKWNLTYQNATVQVLPRINLDHHPLLISNGGESNRRGDRPFIFKLMWSTHPDYENILQQHWDEKM
ncbi:uncharacterized protein [Arachis hypogaea]|uniref:uncharacterized protein n=1 Tax=Arachis hypogaea TaxID=3818 RepID=UPI0010FC5C0F|nr:uncharacterized protein LOC114925009 [Arachis hypogaea]